MTTLDHSNPEALSQAMREWREATQNLRTDLYTKELAKAEAAIRKAREGKVQPGNVFNRTQQENARRQASGAVTSALYKLTEHNGVSNPMASDPEWGHKSTAAAAPKHKPNKYGGRCPQCDGWVEAEAGKLVKVNGKWGAEHLTCPEAAPVKNETVAPSVQGIDLSDLVPGYYAVPGGDTRLKLAISHGKAGGKWEGWSFVKDGAEYGSGERYGMQRPGQAYRGKVEDALRTIVADPKAAMVAYGKLVGRCGACGAKLEDESSVAAGIGPICAGKF